MTSTLILIAWLLAATSAWGAGPVTDLHMSQMEAGTPTPTFVLPTLDGTRIDSRSFFGKVVVLNFWATWCGPCKEEMPSLEKLRQHLNSERFQLFAVTTDTRHQDIAAFWDQLDLHFEVLLDDQEELSQVMMVRNLPTTVVIDSTGHLVGRMMGPRDWDSPESIALFTSLLNKP